MSFAPKEEREAADFFALRDPTALNVGNVIEIEAADGLGLKIFKAAGRRNVGHLRVVGLKSPGNEGGQAARFVLQLPDPFEVLDPLGESFDMAEHHGGGRFPAQFVPDAVDVQPIVGQHFSPGDFLANAVDEDFPAAAGEATEARRLEPLEHGF